MEAWCSYRFHFYKVVLIPQLNSFPRTPAEVCGLCIYINQAVQKSAVSSSLSAFYEQSDFFTGLFYVTMFTSWRREINRRTKGQVILRQMKGKKKKTVTLGQSQSFMRDNSEWNAMGFNNAHRLRIWDPPSMSGLHISHCSQQYIQTKQWAKCKPMFFVCLFFPLRNWRTCEASVPGFKQYPLRWWQNRLLCFHWSERYSLGANHMASVELDAGDSGREGKGNREGFSLDLWCAACENTCRPDEGRQVTIYW